MKELHHITVTALAILLVLCVATCAMGRAAAAEITLTGVITQSTSDGTGPAINNPSLNNIADGDTFAVSLIFNGGIVAPGTYSFGSSSLGFDDLDAASSETDFDPVTLTITEQGSIYNVSLLGCLLTGSSCLAGNELDANFTIPNSGLNSQNVAAQGIPGLFPSLDLLEDDGTTDIQGAVGAYSYTNNPAQSPEPASCVLFSSACALLAAFSRRLGEAPDQPTRQR